MTGPAGGEPGATTNEPPGSRRRGWLGLLIGVVAVSGALVAVLAKRDGGDDETEPRPQREEPTRVEHTWPDDYGGLVWIVVDAADDDTRIVTIQWGPWERRVSHAATEPVAYYFEKNPPQPGDVNVTMSVTVEPGAAVDFDYGDPPDDAVNVAGDWTPVVVDP